MSVHYMSERMDWATPPELFEHYRRRFGISLDVCANEDNAKCPDYFSPEDDGLVQKWGKRTCWMNPPYGTEIAKWVRKASESAKDGAQVICLLPARTDTRWWHDWIWDTENQRPRKGVQVEFLKGRVKFGGAKSGAPFPSCVVIFNPEAA